MEQREHRSQTDERIGTPPIKETRQETRVAVLMPVDNVVYPDEQAKDGQDEEHIAPLWTSGDLGALAITGGDVSTRTLEASAEPSSLRMAAPWAVGLSIFALVATLLLFLANGQTARAPGAADEPPAATETSTVDVAHRDISPAAVAAGSAVAAVVPTPALGYHLFVDATDGFMMQYPHDWAVANASPGARFTITASDQKPLYWVQVDLPDPWALANAGQGPQPTTGGTTDTETTTELSRAWVSYVMSNLASLYPNDDFIQVTAPEQPLAFAGAQWQVGSALLSTRNVQVEVLATVYNGQPYIISLYGADGGFIAGQSQYFDAMLRSFSFTAPPQPTQQP